MEYLIFKTKYLVFKISTKIKNIHNKRIHWIVNRMESDFYLLRKILALIFGQCFIPPLAPTLKEASFEKKSIRNRSKMFSRFLRGIVRSPVLSTHTLVVEFLGTDHHGDSQVKGLNDFNKKLTEIESQL